MGDMVRAEVETRGLTGSPTVFGEVAADLRAKHGDDILAKRLADEVSKLMLVHPIVLIDGMRGTAEYAMFSSRWGQISPALPSWQIKMLGLNAFKRQALRMAIDSSFKSEKTESGWGLNSLIAQADYSITNESSLTELATPPICGCQHSEKISNDMINLR